MFLTMRFALITLALFCALISGWTASLAQVQDLSGTMHHGSAAHSMPTPSAEAHCSTESKVCEHHPRMVHPLLCAACFAVVIDAPGLDRDALAAAAVLPLPQKPLLATTIKPRFPPPKPFVSLS